MKNNKLFEMVFTLDRVLECDDNLCCVCLRTELCGEPVNCLNLKRAGVSEHVSIVLPALLSPTVWRKHDYSFEDIEHTLKRFPLNHLWSLVMYEGLTTSKKRVGQTASSCCDTLTQHFSKQMWSMAETVLSDSRRHTPPIAVHIVPDTVFHAASMECEQSTPVKRYSCLFASGPGSYFVPVEREDPESILMVRVCSEEVFSAIFSQARERPPAVIFAQKRMYLLEEAFLIRVE
jgi:hypothetical protein